MLAPTQRVLPALSFRVVALLAVLALTALVLRHAPALLLRPPLPAAAPAFARLPLAFVPNAGLSDHAVKFQAQAPGGTLFFTASGIVLSLAAPQAAAIAAPAAELPPVPEARAASVVRVQFQGWRSNKANSRNRS